VLAQRNLELYRLKAKLCKTFADPTRLIMIEELRGGEKSVSELIRLLDIPQAAASRHLAVLRDRGVVQTRRKGNIVFYSLTDLKIGEACDLVHNILLNQIEKNRQLAERLVG